jgi:membrane protease subunit (stomatin/prohibitin family)
MARIFDVIEAPDQGRDEIVARFPPKGSGDFRVGSHVIVREFQNAVFFRSGKALDVFKAGDHVISTMNVPLLAGLLGKVFDGKNPFTAEVYFVNMTEFVDLKWGTPKAITMRDPDFKAIQITAFGTYSMQIVDPQLFVNKLVGGRGVFKTKDISDQLRSAIVSRFSDTLAETGKGILDMAALIEELSSAMKIKLTDDFETFGLQLKTFYVQNIGLPDKVQQMLEERVTGAAMWEAGGAQANIQAGTIEAMKKSAEQEGGGGGMATGMGLGGGMAMGAMMAQMMQGGQQEGGGGGGGGGAATVACAKCGTANPPDSKFCKNCGEKMEGGVFCTKCGTANPPDSKFCKSCGEKIDG